MPMINTYEQQTTVNNYGNVPSAPNIQIDQSAAQALGQVGTAINQAAQRENDIANRSQQIDYQIAKKQEQDTAAIWSGKALSDARIKWTTDFLNRQNQAKDAATGFNTALTTDFDKYMEDSLKAAPNEVSKKFLTNGLMELRTSLLTRGAGFENERLVAHNVTQLGDTIKNNASLAAIDPNQAPRAYAETLSVINAATIPQEQKDRLQEDLRRQMVQSYAMSQIENNPTGFKNQLNPSIGKLPEGTPQADIAKAAQANGVDPVTALTIASFESGGTFSPTIKNPNASSKGIYQFTDDTWKRYGGTAANREDPQAQIKAGMQLIKDNTNYLRTELGREPTPKEVYMAHLLGPAGAKAVLSADKDTPIADVIRQYDPKNADDIIKNNGMSGLTAGQAINKFGGKIDQHMRKFVAAEEGASRPFIQNIMTVQEKFAFYNQADQAAQQQMAIQATGLKQQVEDQLTMAMRGQMPQRMMTQDDFNVMYARQPEMASQAFGEYQANMQLGADINRMSNMAPAERMALINSYKPAREQGFADAAKRQDTLLKANAQLAQQFQQDPANYVLQYSPVVRKSYDAMLAAQDPAAKQQAQQNYMQAMLAEQQRQGATQPKLLPENDVQHIVQQAQTANGMQLAQQVTQLEQQYGKYWPMVSQQLGNEKSWPAVANVIANISKPTARADLASVATIPVADLKKNLDSAAVKDVNDKVNSQLDAFVSSLPFGGAGDEKVASTYNEAVQKLAYKYMQQGMGSADAVKQAYSNVLGDYSFKPNKVSGMTARIPNAQNPDQVMRGADSYLKQQLSNANLRLPIDELGFRPEKERRDSFIAEVQANPIWLTNGDETGLTLHTRGYNGVIVPVMKSDGTPLTMSFKDLQGISSQTPTLWEKVKNAASKPAMTLPTMPTPGIK